MRLRHPRLMDEGLFEGPPAFRAAIEKWMIELYAGHILALVEEELGQERALSKPQPDHRAVAIEKNNEALASLEADVRGLKKPGQIARWTVSWGGHSMIVGVKRTEWVQVDDRTQSSEPGATGEPLYVFGKSRLGKKRLTFRGGRYSRKYLMDRVIQMARNEIERMNDDLARTQARVKSGELRPRKQRGMNTERLVELELLRKAAAVYAKKPKKYATKATKNFSIPIGDWRYLDRDIDRDLAKELAKAWKKIKVSLHFKPHGTRGGVWMTKFLWPRGTDMRVVVERELQVDVRNPRATTVDDFNYGLAEIRRVVRHEVQHMGQDFLRGILALASDEMMPKVGFPSRKIRSGGEVAPSAVAAGASEHAMLDVEFYTDLEDAIDRFMRAYKKVPKKLLGVFIRQFIGLYGPRIPQGAHFLRDLQKFKYTQKELDALMKQRADWVFHSWYVADRKGKWRKGVAEFVKEIQKRGVRLPSRFKVEGVRLRAPRLMESGHGDRKRYDWRAHRFRRGQIFRTKAGSELALIKVIPDLYDSNYVDRVRFKVVSIAPEDVAGPRSFFFYDRPKVGGTTEIGNVDLGLIGWPRIPYKG